MLDVVKVKDMLSKFLAETGAGSDKLPAEGEHALALHGIFRIIRHPYERLVRPLKLLNKYTKAIKGGDNNVHEYERQIAESYLPQLSVSVEVIDTFSKYFRVSQAAIFESYRWFSCKSPFITR